MTGLLDDKRLDLELLDAYGFDRTRFEAEVARIRAGELRAESSIIRDPLAPVDGVTEANWNAREITEAGERALQRGAVAIVVLNGGMATRFGNVVKGTVDVVDGKSFLAIKAEDVRRACRHYGRPIPLVLMNSFATDAATRAHIEAHDGFGLRADLLTFCQSISVRLTPDGALFIGDDGKPSYHAPGHGDFFGCIRESGILAELARRGVEVICFSNVDNLGATVDPTIVGHHLASNADMTVEVTAKRRTASGEWDKGGAPAIWRHRAQLVEGFRMPADMPPTSLPDFSTNNFCFGVDAIDREIPLERHVVVKKVDGRPALQLESIAAEASAWLSLNVLRVPREGPRGRFFPVKEPVDLEALRDSLKARLEAGWSLRDL